MRFMIVALIASILLVGCNSTGPSKDALRAENAVLSADLKAANAKLEMGRQIQDALDRQLAEEYRRWQMNEGRRAHKPGSN